MEFPKLRVVLPKEKISVMIEEVTLVNTNRTATLFVTNFRLILMEESLEDVIAMGTIPLATIEKFRKLPSHHYNNNLRLLQILGKDLRILVFGFQRKTGQRKVIILELMKRCRPTCLSDLYAYVSGPLKYRGSDPRENVLEELERLRSMNNSTREIRITNANSDYSLCSSYPSAFLVPSCITDEELWQSATFRKRGRIPAITWCHPKNGAVLSRSSQPMVGIMNAGRNQADERLVAALAPDKKMQGKVYIGDVRPHTNAVANMAKGGGTESSAVYRNSEVVFFGIDNIHCMTGSFARLREYLDRYGGVCSDGQQSIFRDREWSWTAGYVRSMSMCVNGLERSGWLSHIHSILANSVWVTARIGIVGASVLVHCSDGWDRTSQIISLAELLLDPYYRTFEGFRTLIEKDWLGFGHPFGARLGLPSFCRGYSKDCSIDCVRSPGSSSRGSIKEDSCSPIFFQWIDCVTQLLRIYPCAFEFSVSFLVDLVNLVMCSRFGNFLCNNEKERVEADVAERCGCVWEFLREMRAGKTHKHYNPFYDKEKYGGSQFPAPAMLVPSLCSHLHLHWSSPDLYQFQESVVDKYMEMGEECHELEFLRGLATDKQNEMEAMIQELTREVETARVLKEEEEARALIAVRELEEAKAALQSLECDVEIYKESNNRDEPGIDGGCVDEFCVKISDHKDDLLNDALGYEYTQLCINNDAMQRLNLDESYIKDAMEV